MCMAFPYSEYYELIRLPHLVHSRFALSASSCLWPLAKGYGPPTFTRNHSSACYRYKLRRNLWTLAISVPQMLPSPWTQPGRLPHGVVNLGANSLSQLSCGPLTALSTLYRICSTWYPFGRAKRFLSFHHLLSSSCILLLHKTRFSIDRYSLSMPPFQMT